MEYKGFIGGSYQSQAATADYERTVNLYVERMESQGATTRAALYPTPGFELLVATNSSDGRAHLFVGGREWAVIGSAFIEIDGDGNITFRGTVAMDSNPATLSSNGDGGGQIFITSGGNGYVWDIGAGTLTQITALNGIATMGDAIDGYFLALNAADGTFYVSELLDGLTWNTGTMFAQRNSAPDPWIALKVYGRYIWLLGDQTGEVWYNAGTSPFPFAQHASGLIPWGTAAPFSLKVCGTALCWLGASKNGAGFVLRAPGFSPEVASTYAVQYAINGYGTISDACADTYNDGGHTFYILSFPKANKTWAYDLEMQLWAERGTWDPASTPGDFGIWRPRCHAYAFGEHRWLHGSGVGVYRMDRSLVSDVDDLAIVRERIGPQLVSELERIYFSEFQLDLEPGLGTASGQGSDPQVMLQWSDDGGKTWGSEVWRSAGKMGQYQRRVIWQRLGHARRRLFRVRMSDPIPWRMTAAYVKATPSTALRGAA